jgi:hypothetical protein
VVVDSTKTMQLNITLHPMMQEDSDSEERTVKHLVILPKCTRKHTNLKLLQNTDRILELG